jgi:hypothetical protein
MDSDKAQLLELLAENGFVLVRQRKLTGNFTETTEWLLSQPEAFEGLAAKLPTSIRQ